MKKKKAKASDLIEQPGFYLGPFPKGKLCEEKRCLESAFTATDDNSVRCYEHTLAYIEACKAKATRTPPAAFDALTEQIKKVRAMRS